MLKTDDKAVSLRDVVSNIGEFIYHAREVGVVNSLLRLDVVLDVWIATVNYEQIIVPWPSKPSSDPNDVYREWLETNIGIQNYDWCWGPVDHDIWIKVRKKHAEQLTLFVLSFTNSQPIT